MVSKGVSSCVGLERNTASNATATAGRLPWQVAKSTSSASTRAGLKSSMKHGPTPLRNAWRAASKAWPTGTWIDSKVLQLLRHVQGQSCSAKHGPPPLRNAWRAAAEARPTVTWLISKVLHLYRSAQGLQTSKDQGSSLFLRNAWSAAPEAWPTGTWANSKNTSPASSTRKARIVQESVVIFKSCTSLQRLRRL